VKKPWACGALIITLTGIIWAGLAVPPDVPAKSPHTRLTTVADTNTQIPDVLAGINFGRLWYPAINGGKVGFIGSDLTYSFMGVYLFKDGHLKKIADHDTFMPGLQECFYSFDSLVVGSDYIAFVGTNREFTATGVYLHDGSRLRRVADVTTPMPGSSRCFGRFDGLAISGKNLLFWARSDNQSEAQPVDGLYLFDGEGIRTVADTDTLVPEGEDTFTFFWEHKLSGEKVAFLASYSSCCDAGIYLHDGKKLKKVADNYTEIPGAGGLSFTGLDFIAISGKEVAFRGDNLEYASEGIYLKDGKELKTVAGPSVTVPGTEEGFLYLYRPAFSGKKIMFYGGNTSAAGLYLYDGPELKTVVDTETLIPGENTHFSWVSDLVVSNGKVAFRSAGEPISGLQGLYLHDGKNLLVIADTNTTMPGTEMTFGPFVTLGEGYLSLSGRHVAFWATGGPENFHGIYLFEF
jgi:hypothetical protein